MWEYQIKPKRPIDPHESSDIHPATHPTRPGAERHVGAHPEENIQNHKKANPDHTGHDRHYPANKRQLQCPACQKSTMQREFIGKVEIDRCPVCGGIFLDRGELETISHQNPSSYTPAQKSDHREYIVYTPHGLSDHVRDVGHD